MIDSILTILGTMALNTGYIVVYSLNMLLTNLINIPLAMLHYFWQTGLNPIPEADQTAITTAAAAQGVNIYNFLLVSGLLFTIGITGVLTRRNLIIVFISVELILNAVNINLVAFSRYWQIQGAMNPTQGQVFTVFVIVVAAAEAAVGLAILLAYYRQRQTVAIEEINLLKW
jgi:NADH:ubiquinone oxidoreductase subunit K